MNSELVTLDLGHSIWERFFSVAPLAVVGTKEGDSYNLAPKHMISALGWCNYVGFVCTPAHATFRNIERERAFTMSFIRPSQVVVASLAASPRCGDGGDEKPILDELKTFPANTVDGVFVDDAYLYLECELHKIVSGFDNNALIAGKIVDAHVDAEALRTSDRDDQGLLMRAPLLAYLCPGRFAEIRETYAFPFPEEMAG